MEGKNRSQIDAIWLLGLMLFGLFACCQLYSRNTKKYDVTIDDSYITLRYARNLADGKGLTFNPPEKVEGYTNFLMVIFLAILDPALDQGITIAKQLSYIFGLVALLMAVMFAIACPGINGRLWMIVAALFFASSPYLAYWSSSGMETSLFAALLITGALFTAFYLEFNRSWMLIISGFAWTLCAMTRPEGYLPFVLLMIFIIGKRKVMKPRFWHWVAIVLPTIIYQAFRIIYFGSLLPNTFIAKTRFDIEQVIAGLKYSAEFINNTGLVGIMLLLAVVGSLIVNRVWVRYLGLFTFLYWFYVILIGGDVMRGGRFFVPILFPLYLLAMLAVERIISVISYRFLAFWRQYPKDVIAIIVFIVLLAGGSIFQKGSDAYLTECLVNENDLVGYWSSIGRWLKDNARADSLIACTVIGAIPYYSGLRTIDMIGLTEPYIARYPNPIQGIESSWRERKYNAEYVLDQKPDFIIFALGFKISAACEKALYTDWRFRNLYYRYLVELPGDYLVFYRRKPPPVCAEISQRLSATEASNVSFIHHYDRAYRAFATQDYRVAIKHAQKAEAMLPEDGLSEFFVLKGLILRQLGRYDKSRDAFAVALEQNSFSIEALYNLGEYYLRSDEQKARDYYSRALKLDPELGFVRSRLEMLE